MPIQSSLKKSYPLGRVLVIYYDLGERKLDFKLGFEFWLCMTFNNVRSMTLSLPNCTARVIIPRTHVMKIKREYDNIQHNVYHMRTYFLFIFFQIMCNLFFYLHTLLPYNKSSVGFYFSFMTHHFYVNGTVSPIPSTISSFFMYHRMPTIGYIHSLKTIINSPEGYFHL